jgi:DNA-directed RNA polymerase specialized sigma24 family protein
MHMMLTDAPRTDIAPELADGAALFRSYYRYLFAIARRLRSRTAPYDRAFDTEDLAQEIASAVFRGRHYFRPERGRLTHWLGRMAVRTAWAVNKSARAHRRDCPAESGERLNALSDASAARPPVTGDCWPVVARLVTPVELRALVLRFVEELDHKEIGARLAPNCVGRSREARASQIIDGALKKLYFRRFELLQALGLC